MVVAAEEKVRWRARPAHHRIVHELRRACERADTARLTSLLQRDIAVVVDAGDDSHPTIRMVRGMSDAVPLLLHGMGPGAHIDIEERTVNGQAGLLLHRGDVTIAVVGIDVTSRLISAVWILLNPEPLRRGNHT